MTQAHAIIGQASPALQGGGHGGGHATSVVLGPVCVWFPAAVLPAEHGGGQELEVVPDAVSAMHGGGQMGWGWLLLPSPLLELPAGHGGQGTAGHGASGGQLGGGGHGGGVHLDPFAQCPGKSGTVGAELP